LTRVADQPAIIIKIRNAVTVLIAVASISYVIVINICLFAIWEINTVVKAIRYTIAILVFPCSGTNIAISTLIGIALIGVRIRRAVVTNIPYTVTIRISLVSIAYCWTIIASKNTYKGKVDIQVCLQQLL